LSVRQFSLDDGTVDIQMCDASGTLIASLPSVAETPPFMPDFERVTAQGAERSYDAVLVRPRDFTAGLSYPVILSVYAGPTGKVVHSTARGYLRDQWLADQGYIVVALDGRGTPGYGRDWERAIYKNLIDVALEDQIDGLQALGRAYPELDMTRVGVTGWSFGGYFSAMATLRRPDIFRAGVAGASVTDWHEYDTCYTERYMDLPAANPNGYRAASAMTYADQLERPLMLIHGVTDDNVYFVHTLKLCEALFQAGKPYDLLPMTGTHMAGAADPVHQTRLWGRIMAFFGEHLQ
jgi:dipeptidyl-peptidase-4